MQNWEMGGQSIVGPLSRDYSTFMYTGIYLAVHTAQQGVSPRGLPRIYRIRIKHILQFMFLLYSIHPLFARPGDQVS